MSRCDHSTEKICIEAELAASAKLDATSRKKEVGLNMIMEETRVMIADLSLMGDDTRAWFLKKRQTIINRQD
jgi:hypothetical protein